MDKLDTVIWKHAAYRTVAAFAILDLGLDTTHAWRYSVLNGIDTDGDGVIDAGDIVKTRQILNQEAVQAGASTINFKTGCVHVDTIEGYVATNDRVLTFHKGTYIEVATRPAGITAGMLQFMIDEKLVEGVSHMKPNDVADAEEAAKAVSALSAFMDENGELNFESLKDATPAVLDTKGAFNIDEKYRDDYDKALAIANYLRGVPAIGFLHVDVLITVLKQIVDTKLIEFSNADSEGLMGWFRGRL